MSRFRFRSFFPIMAAMLSVLSCGATELQSVEIISYGGNSRAWNEILGITAIRLGCSAGPKECMRRATIVAEQQAVDTVLLAVKLSRQSPQEMVEYSRLAATNDVLGQVGIDDFVGEYARLSNAVSLPAETLDNAIQGLKSIKSDLRFGITLYEDDLNRELLQDDKLPARIRAKVDDVHLYLHYRESAPNYAAYVRQAKTLFPNAKIIAGAYAYDRIDYISCAMGDRKRCSIQQEIRLFRESLEQQLDLLQHGNIGGIEFYPAKFGSEASWSGWDNVKACRTEYRERCVETTLQMRQIVRTRMTSIREALGRK